MKLENQDYELNLKRRRDSRGSQPSRPQMFAHSAMNTPKRHKTKSQKFIDFGHNSKKRDKGLGNNDFLHMLVMQGIMLEHQLDLIN